MASTKIRFRRSRLRSEIVVEDWPDQSLAPFVCSSSAKRAVVFEGSRWNPGEKDAIEKRLGSGGSEKGRVLWAVNYYMVSGCWEAVGALLLHVPQRKSRPIMIKRVCLRQDLNRRDKDKATAVLIGCAKHVAEVSHKAGGRLQWEVKVSDARQLCEQYGFSRRGNNRQMAVLEWKPSKAHE